MTFLIRLATCALLLALTGCASLTGGNTQSMFVQVKDVAGAPVAAASCVLSNDKGSWNLKAPNDITIARSNRAMALKCNSADQPPGALSVESTTRAAMFGNIIFGGLIGVGIDHYSGAAYEYPGIATVVMGQSAQMKMEYVPGGGGTPSVAVARLIPETTGFAGLEDVEAVPALGPKGREEYQKFLNYPLPRAFAINGSGGFASSYTLRPLESKRPADPALRALEFCRERTRTACRLYAVDKGVVYVAPTSRQAAAALPIAQSLRSRYESPEETRFADINDASLVPVRVDGQGKYLQYLTLPMPRAFAIATDGSWTMAADNPAAMADVLNACEREGKQCWLYAVDDRVVWQSEPAKRIGRVGQLIRAAAP